jgi:N4-(beta-N-acetylglucosaminyl)-L-asparaginase
MGFHKHSLKTELSTKMHQDWLKANCQPNFWKNVTPDPRQKCGPYKPLSNTHSAEDRDRSFSKYSHDTIGMIIIDKNMDVSVGTSTNGARNKIAG